MMCWRGAVGHSGVVSSWCGDVVRGGVVNAVAGQCVCKVCRLCVVMVLNPALVCWCGECWCWLW